MLSVYINSVAGIRNSDMSAIIYNKWNGTENSNIDNHLKLHYPANYLTWLGSCRWINSYFARGRKVREVSISNLSLLILCQTGK